MFGCENRTTVPLEVMFSVRRSHNCARSSPLDTVRKVVEPNKTEFLMHVRRENLGSDLKLDYDFKHKEVA